MVDLNKLEKQVVVQKQEAREKDLFGKVKTIAMYFGKPNRVSYADELIVDHFLIWYNQFISPYSETEKRISKIFYKDTKVFEGEKSFWTRGSKIHDPKLTEKEKAEIKCYKPAVGNWLEEFDIIYEELTHKKKEKEEEKAKTSEEQKIASLKSDFGL
jgi:hypothetical protein